MFPRRIFVLFVIVFVVHGVVVAKDVCSRCTDMKMLTSRVSVGLRLNATVIEERRGLGFLQCVQACMVDSRCASVNYFTAVTSCTLNRESDLNSSNDVVVETESVYTAMHNWPQILATRCYSSSCPGNTRCMVAKGRAICIPVVYGAIITSVVTTSLTVNYTCKPDHNYVYGTTTAYYHGNDTWTIPTMLCAPTQCYVYIKHSRYAIYDGNVSTTKTGIPCKRWDANKYKNYYIHAWEFNTDLTMDEVANQCRGLDSNAAPWCYTTSPSVRWEFCDVTECTEDILCKDFPIIFGARPELITKTIDTVTVQYTCKKNLYLYSGNTIATCDVTGRWIWPTMYCLSNDCYYTEFQPPSVIYLYSGHTDVSEKNMKCQRWDKRHPHNHGVTSIFPENMTSSRSLHAARNYCRSIAHTGVPRVLGCFTLFNLHNGWQRCNIPPCDLGYH